MAKAILVKNNYKENEVTLTYSDGSKSTFEVIDGVIPVDVFRRLEVALFHGSTIKVKGFV